MKTIYLLTPMLENLNLAKSSYFHHSSQSILPDKYADLRALLKEFFIENRSTYGYRRMHEALKKQHIVVSEKAVRRIMKEEKLIVRSISKNKYSSYAGEINPATPNLIQRNFKAEAPDEKWLTDITEFQIPAEKIYLSSIIDCFDGAVVSQTIGTQPNAELVNSMFDQALEEPSGDSNPIVHSDRGVHYRWPGWIERIKTNGLTQSMSKNGCPPDNSACEGFFERLKTEFFHGLRWENTSIDAFIGLLDEYLQNRVPFSLLKKSLRHIKDTRVISFLFWRELFSRSLSEYTKLIGGEC